jgi:hypothetical protein
VPGAVQLGERGAAGLRDAELPAHAPCGELVLQLFDEVGDVFARLERR